MKKLLIASLLSLSVIAGVQAQETESRYSKPDASRIAQYLDITESQLPAFQAVMQEQFEKRRALHAEFREQNKALNAETQENLAGVLTPEQLQKLQSMKDRKNAKWHGERKQHHHKRGQGKDRAPAIPGNE